MRKWICLALFVCLSLLCACGAAESSKLDTLADVTNTIYSAQDSVDKDLHTLVIDAFADAFVGKPLVSSTLNFTTDESDEPISFTFAFDIASSDETLYRDWAFIYDRNTMQFTTDSIVEEFYAELDMLDQIQGMIDAEGIENPTFPIGTPGDDVTGTISLVPLLYFTLFGEGDEPVADLMLWDCEIGDSGTYQGVAYFFLRCPLEDGSIWCLNCADPDLSATVYKMLTEGAEE